MPCIAEYSGPSSSLTLLVIREKVAEGIQSKVYARTVAILLLPNVLALLHFTRVLATE